MKMHYSEILFFSLSLNILITSSYAHNKNKPHITQHTPTNTTRVLSECNLYMPNYDNDADMKSVKENFDRQTSRRFEEYEERVKDKRQKCKEQCDKEIQKIILKDKIQKSLEEKVEKGCLRCGCGLGGVAASIYNQRNHNSTTHHTLKIPITRLLCECELYELANYDNDPQMKEVMENFIKQTQQRFHDYDDRMKEKRKQCKDRCDKEIQNIILKDKLEKELMDKFATLQTDIQSDSIPTCICEKSLEDKMEKECLKCAQNLGGIVAPSTGVLGEIAALAVNAWKTEAIVAATQEAIAKGTAAGKAAGDIAGLAIVMKEVESQLGVSTLGGQPLEIVFNVKNYADASLISRIIKIEYYESRCGDVITGVKKPFCTFVNERIGYTSVRVRKSFSAYEFIETTVEEAVAEGTQAAETEAAKVAAAKTPEFTTRNIAAVEAATTPYYTPIIASIIAIVVIILIMVIIYLILRYRRKKKMKKKLQYIKLLKE
ncbi:hypothetical protein PFUGPA_05970 [Plasmodium falciparum Palo Alto/Uganda]|uniref:Rifin n=1 Tax=Plasmodium falciparum (isolate Palo Alto / Uganda) TaxID=57270 RepID=W4IRS9_PLAFP|nr:hypothetical protein PFUGPA_05970 [Plasmodium falciparum Palo Alto/Uganda]